MMNDGIGLKRRMFVCLFIGCCFFKVLLATHEFDFIKKETSCDFFLQKGTKQTHGKEKKKNYSI